MALPIPVFVSCEHASNRVPEAYRHLFKGQDAVLETHRGCDIGSQALAEALAAEFMAPLLSADISRLLVDLNRPLTSRSLFSEFTRPLPHPERQNLLRRYHHPYWKAAEDHAAGIISSRGQVLHISVHSFTPVLHGEVRNADIGLLYDPRRSAEKALSLEWQEHLAARRPDLRIRRNYPYRGNAAALVTTLRGRFPARVYLGIELEVNQQIPRENRQEWETLQEILIASLKACRGPCTPT